MLRNTLVLANTLAVIGYWAFPTAPPRLAGVGIADTVSGATSINLTSSVASAFYNPYAAVPSMHIGFSLLVGVTIVLLAKRRPLRIAGALYPLFVLFVIVATGIHFFLDAAAGALVAIAAGAIVLASARVGEAVRAGYATRAEYGARAPLMIRSYARRTGESGSGTFGVICACSRISLSSWRSAWSKVRPSPIG